MPYLANSISHIVRSNTFSCFNFSFFVWVSSKNVEKKSSSTLKANYNQSNYANPPRIILGFIWLNRFACDSITHLIGIFFELINISDLFENPSATAEVETANEIPNIKYHYSRNQKLIRVINRRKAKIVSQ